MSRLLRPLFVGMRAPALADRRGLRWMLSERLWPAPVLVIRHRGRKSGKLYTTPIEAITEDRAHGEVVISPLRGADSDWYRNVVAGGFVDLRLRGQSHDALWRELSREEAIEALNRYLEAHPRYARIVLRSIGRLHGISPEAESVAATLPMLSVALTPREDSPA